MVVCANAVDYNAKQEDITKAQVTRLLRTGEGNFDLTLTLFCPVIYLDVLAEKTIQTFL